MAFRWLIYSTGTTYADTVVGESTTLPTPQPNEASLYTDFVIPEIQPLYLWRVTGGTDVVPNTDSNISAYLEATAPAPQPEDDASVGFVTGETATKIDKVTGITDNLGVFNAEGNLVDGGYTIPELTGLTTYTFTGSGGTQVFESGNDITIYSTDPTGTTVAWGSITGTLANQTDLQNELNAKLDVSLFNSYTGTTDTRFSAIESDITYLSGQTDLKLNITDFNTYTGTTQPVIDSALTGVTNLGTGTTLGGTSGRNVTVKSISVLGGLSISGDVNNLIISGQTGSSGGGTWGTITGTLSDQTDLWFTLTGMTAETANKLDTVVFSAYTGTTETRLTGIESDITYLSGQTDLKLNITDFNTYTGTTQPVIDAALTGATNGLSANGRDVELGGTLTKHTAITGTSFDFTLNVADILIQGAGTGGVSIVDTDGTGGVVIESDSGTVALIGNTALGAETTKLEISETLMKITDSRTGATQVGMVYDGDYSANFVDESLITKRYADTIAGGLIPKAAVDVATTSGITLSGLQTIDGVALTGGERVLVKDQVSGETNGIYIAGAGAWTRSTDFDGNPDGEVSAGDIIPVLTGDTQYSTLWVLVTPNPITVGTTPLDFSLFSSPHEMIAGHGISIDINEISVDGTVLAGNSIAWTGSTGNETYNVDIDSGTLKTALDSKLDVSAFNSYSATTDTRIDALETGLTTVENQVTGLTATFTGYTATTETRLETIESDITGNTAAIATKLDTDIFTGYTATTTPNEIFLIHTGGTDINTVAATAIDWDATGVTGATGAAFSWTGGSDITILEDGDYEVNYNIPYNIASNSSIGVGANVILNNSIVIDVTAAAALATRNAGAASIGLPSVVLSLTANDVLTLAAFRTHQSGTAITSLTGSILIKKKNTLQ